MAQDNLGLFDTPPDRQEIRVALVLVSVLVAAFFLILPVRHIPLPQIQAFIPTIDSITLLGELVTATLLYSQAAVFRSRALTVLATGYTAVAMLLVPHALTFPGAFAPEGVLGAGNKTAAIIYISRQMILASAVLLYVHLKRSDPQLQSSTQRPPERVLEWVFAAMILTAAITIFAAVGKNVVPPFFLDNGARNQPYAFGLTFGLLSLYVIAAASLYRERRSILDMWLLVSLSGWVIQSLLNVFLEGRFTLGFYCYFLLMPISTLMVMIALIAESSRSHTRLALLRSAQKRERDAQLQSAGAAAVAISHEVAQPLSAVLLNSSAGLRLLTRTQPDIPKAIEAFQAIRSAGQLTFDVLKSTQKMFGERPGTVTEFCLNELICETTSLMRHELSHAKISMELVLDECTPPITGNRIQLQRVLVNLISNAIESLTDRRRRPRRITIRAAPIEAEGVLLEVSDTGIGIDPEEMAHIFDAFITTKAAGTGLGLSLCRIIVEEHGGRIWGTDNEGAGATFHLQLPYGALPEQAQ